MKIYTRTGDAGTTGLYGGGRVPKCDPRIAACGAVDELNAVLGAARATALPADVDAVVARIQHEAFCLGAELGSRDGAPAGIRTLGEAETSRLEREIDQFEGALPPLTQFILPGGAPTAAALHVARCVCRRAEREVVALSESATVRPEAIAYLNRVGDLLFVLARFANQAAGMADVPWEK